MSSRNLPHHRYVWVDSSFIRDNAEGFEPAVWFAIRGEPNRAWGCHVMLQCGAIYRNLPPHALAFRQRPAPNWGLGQAQVWDCYGRDFDVIEYDYLRDLRARYDVGSDMARYLFTACPHGDGFSMAPDQSKEFMFMETEGGRLLVRPTNMLLFEERSFTEWEAWPDNIVTTQNVWRCEE